MTSQPQEPCSGRRRLTDRFERLLDVRIETSNYNKGPAVIVHGGHLFLVSSSTARSPTPSAIRTSWPLRSRLRSAGARSVRMECPGDPGQRLAVLRDRRRRPLWATDDARPKSPGALRATPHLTAGSGVTGSRRAAVTKRRLAGSSALGRGAHGRPRLG